jgi:hypothetical protein
MTHQAPPQSSSTPAAREGTRIRPHQSRISLDQLGSFWIMPFLHVFQLNMAQIQQPAQAEAKIDFFDVSGKLPDISDIGQELEGHDAS